LGSSRGGFDCDRIIESILEHKITQVYVIGGDGTHRGATILFDEIRKRKLKISIIGGGRWVYLFDELLIPFSLSSKDD
jgi:6-phosphofructokinase 1